MRDWDICDSSIRIGPCRRKNCVSRNRAQTLAHRRVTGWRPTLGCGSTPRWHTWSDRAKASPALADATYPYPKKTPRFLGTVIQKYRPRKGAPTIGFQRWIDSISEKVQTRLYPALHPLGMTLEPEAYKSVEGLWPDLCLSQIADFNTLIAKSQESNTPVFALTDAQLGSVGTVLRAEQGKRDEFRNDFTALATKIDKLTSHESCS